MSNWKDMAISDLIALQTRKKIVEKERAEDEDILNASILMTKAIDKITELELPYTDKIADLDSAIEKTHELLIDSWDITDKTYECEAGTATVRVTRALKIADKKQLISILLNIDKLPECIRSWNLSYLRKLKDVDLIDDTIAHYDENRSVIVKGVPSK